MHILKKAIFKDGIENMISILVTLVVILLIFTLYIGIISSLIFLISLIPVLNVTINNWYSLFAFSLLIILWIVPYVLINIFQSIPIKNKILKRLIRIISELISVFLFTLYVLFLDKHFVNLSFSTIGTIFVIVTILVLSIIINIAGERLKDKDKK